jgi:hypothetical protein
VLKSKNQRAHRGLEEHQAVDQNLSLILQVLQMSFLVNLQPQKHLVSSVEAEVKAKKTIPEIQSLIQIRNPDEDA